MRSLQVRFGSALCLLTAVLCMAAMAVPAGADEEDKPVSIGPVYSNNPVVAVVENRPIRLYDLRNAPINEMMVQLHRMQKMMLQEKALEYLVREHPEMEVGAPDEIKKEDIERFYKATAEVQTMGTLDEMEPNIRHYLEELSHVAYLERVDKRFRQAVQKGYIQDYFEAPEEFKLVASVGTAMRWFQDKHERRVFFLEFSDFQCPFCKRVQGTLAKLRSKYSQDVQFGYRHFPLPFHKEAAQLAEAVECARDQGRFWDVQGAFYQNPDGVQEYAQMLHLAQKAGVKDMDRFGECLASRKYRKRVQQDIEDGSKLGINGTPTFVIGLYDPHQDTVSGEMFSGAVTEEKFVTVIEKYLAQEPKVAKTPCLGC